MAKGVEVRLYDASGTAQANLTGLQCVWFDEAQPKDFNAPRGVTYTATTDADGDLILNLDNVTHLSSGDYGFLVVYKLDGTDHKDSPAFVSKLQVSSITGGTTLGLAASDWVRNPSWLTMTTITSSENKFVGLHAVFPDDSNFCALQFTVTGGYTVDWGDGGSTENVNSATTAYHKFNYADVTATTDVGIADAFAVTFTDSGDTVNSTAHGLENGQRIAFSSITSTTGISANTLYYVVGAGADTFQVADTQGGAAKSLTTDGSGSAYVPKYRQVLVTVTPQAANPFTSFNLNLKHSQSGLQAYATGWLDIRFSCPSLTSLTFGGSNVYQSLCEQFEVIAIGAVTTSFSYMFSSCYSLQSVPLLDTSSGTDFSYMFYNCYSLQSVPLLDTSGGTNFSSMFSGCSSLQSVPLFDTSGGTNFSYMFYNCSSLQSVPLFNTSSGTSFQAMFYTCYSLQSVPLFDTSGASDFSYMFNACYSLQSVPLFDTSSGTNFSSMFNYCSALQSVPLLDVADQSGNFTNIFVSCRSLSTGALLNSAQTISYSGCKLSATELNRVFSNLASVPAATKTITITNNWGAAKVSLSGTTTTGSTTVTMASTTGLAANMWITGTGISSGRSVTFTDSGDTVNLTGHGIPNGTMVSFSAITSTTGISAYIPYYVVNAATDTFQVADTVGGSAKTLTTDGSGTLLYPTYIVSIVPNTSITLSIPASADGSITTTSTMCNTGLATLKNWTVTN